MDVTVNILNKTSGRDKFIRLSQYALLIAVGSSKGPLTAKLGAIAKQMSSARLILRVYDDPSMIKAVLNYGLGRSEKDLVTRLCTLSGTWAITAYYPMEHIAWLADHKILPIESKNWTTAGVALWAIYLVAAIIKSFRRLCILRKQKAAVIKQKKLESPDRSDAAARATFRQEMQKLSFQEIDEIWNILKNVADLLNAVSWLPEGFLWAGKFTTFQNGVFGTISSLIGLTKMYIDSWV